MFTWRDQELGDHKHVEKSGSGINLTQCFSHVSQNPLPSMLNEKNQQSLIG